MSNHALSEEWVVLSAIEVQAEAMKEEMSLSHVLQGLNLTDEITARITEDLTRALTGLCTKTTSASVRILCRCKERVSENKNGIKNHNNHSPPATWNYFIIERKGNQMAAPLIELYLFPDW